MLDCRAYGAGLIGLYSRAWRDALGDNAVARQQLQCPIRFTHPHGGGACLEGDASFGARNARDVARALRVGDVSRDRCERALSRLGLLLLVDLRRGAEAARRVAVAVEERHGAPEEPPVHAVVPAQSILGGPGLDTVVLERGHHVEVVRVDELGPVDGGRVADLVTRVLPPQRRLT